MKYNLFCTPHPLLCDTGQLTVSLWTLVSCQSGSTGGEIMTSYPSLTLVCRTLESQLSYLFDVYVTVYLRLGALLEIHFLLFKYLGSPGQRQKCIRGKEGGRKQTPFIRCPPPPKRHLLSYFNSLLESLCLKLLMHKFGGMLSKYSTSKCRPLGEPLRDISCSGTHGNNQHSYPLPLLTGVPQRLLWVLLHAEVWSCMTSSVDTGNVTGDGDYYHHGAASLEPALPWFCCLLAY